MTQITDSSSFISIKNGDITCTHINMKIKSISSIACSL